MTPGQLLQVLNRRWWLFGLLLALTAGAVAFLPADTGVYWARSTVVFVPPLNASRPGNVLEGSDPTLVYFAAAVERMVDDGQHTSALSSSSATLYGIGTRQGHSITLINSGGQWQTNFNRPMLAVEVVGDSLDAATAEMSLQVGRINDVMAQLQVEAGATPQRMIRTEVLPRQPVVSFVSGSAKRAAAGTLLLGTALSLWVTCLVDRVALRRRRLLRTA